MLREHEGDYLSLWSAIKSTAPSIGCLFHTLNQWVRRKQGAPSVACDRPEGVVRRGTHTGEALAPVLAR